jgi:thioredoxin-related protein
MVASSSSRPRIKLRNSLDVITNIVVVVFALVAIGTLVKNYFTPTVTRTNSALKSGDVFPEIEGADYRKVPRTLILALNVDCRYCTKSLPFYNSLANAQKENPNQFTVVAAFINKEEERVRSYVEEKALSVQAIAGVDLDKLGIHSTPTLILVDSGGKVLDSWTGELKHDGEVEVFRAIGLPYRPTASTSTVSIVRKTADIFSEERSVLSIQPESKPQRHHRFR